MSYKRNTTDVYPTRYHAFDNPGTWAIFTPTDGKYRSCREDSPLRPVTQLGAFRTCPGVHAPTRAKPALRTS